MDSTFTTGTELAAWKTLRSNVVCGVALSPDEASVYAAGETMFDAQEAAMLRAGATRNADTLRQETARLEAEAERLRETSRNLAERIRVLEAQLEPLLAKNKFYADPPVCGRHQRRLARKPPWHTHFTASCEFDTISLAVIAAFPKQRRATS